MLCSSWEKIIYQLRLKHAGTAATARGPLTWVDVRRTASSRTRDLAWWQHPFLDQVFQRMDQRLRRYILGEKWRTAPFADPRAARHTKTVRRSTGRLHRAAPQCAPELSWPAAQPEPPVQKEVDSSGGASRRGRTRMHDSSDGTAPVRRSRSGRESSSPTPSTPPAASRRALMRPGVAWSSSDSEFPHGAPGGDPHAGDGRDAAHPDSGSGARPGPEPAVAC